MAVGAHGSNAAHMVMTKKQRERILCSMAFSIISFYSTKVPSVRVFLLS
jgi:hypothetical protein